MLLILSLDCFMIYVSNDLPCGDYIVLIHNIYNHLWKAYDFQNHTTVIAPSNV